MPRYAISPCSFFVPLCSETDNERNEHIIRDNLSSFSIFQQQREGMTPCQWQCRRARWEGREKKEGSTRWEKTENRSKGTEVCWKETEETTKCVTEQKGGEEREAKQLLIHTDRKPPTATISRLGCRMAFAKCLQLSLIMWSSHFRLLWLIKHLWQITMLEVRLHWSVRERKGRQSVGARGEKDRRERRRRIWEGCSTRERGELGWRLTPPRGQRLKTHLCLLETSSLTAEWHNCLLIGTCKRTWKWTSEMRNSGRERSHNLCH